MINRQTFESLILTNTIVAAFCIVLLVTFTVFVILFLVPSFRRRWFTSNVDQDENTLTDVSAFIRQPSFRHLALGSSRYNPVFEPTTTTTTTQFGTLFHPHATAATLLHPTIWTSINPTSMLSSPPPSSTPAQSSSPTTATPKSPKKT